MVSEKGVNVGRFVDQLGNWLAEPVAGASVDPEQCWTGVTNSLLQLGHELVRVKGNHPVVAVAGRDQSRGINVGDNIVQRGVGDEVLEVLRVLLGVAVLGGPVPAGRKTVVAKHVRDGNHANNRTVQIGALQQTGSHQ